MAKTKELTEDLRLRIVDAHKSGKGYKTISKGFEVPVATVQSIIKKYKTFRNVKNLRGRGRKPKVTPVLARRIVKKLLSAAPCSGSPQRTNWSAQQLGTGFTPDALPAATLLFFRAARRIVREVKKNPRITTKAILMNLGSAGGSIARQTVQWTLHTAGFHGRRPRRTPLQKRHTKARLAFANAHLDKEEDFWSFVLCCFIIVEVCWFEQGHVEHERYDNLAHLEPGVWASVAVCLDPLSPNGSLQSDMGAFPDLLAPAGPVVTFENLSIATRIELYPSDLGRLITKSTAMRDQGHLGMGKCSSKPMGSCQLVHDSAQVLQDSTYPLTSWVSVGHQNRLLIRVVV
ncbi:hypothetical protein QTP70_013496 [Hemibagrus guttatus]|uniref:Transposase Tc1-like domain-containing protein n=1 Tax=Hemibagrus guttatus TaxID=175788 RepID=A0AAE0UPT5_9TELE|nr:hypothetical protein QTP70_013496 [Hemibagrus guttatus]